MVSKLNCNFLDKVSCQMKVCLFSLLDGMATMMRAYFEKEVSVEIGWNVSNQKVTQN